MSISLTQLKLRLYKDELTVEMILSYFDDIVQSLKFNDNEFELNFNYKIKLSVITADVLSEKAYADGKKKPSQLNRKNNKEMRLRINAAWQRIKLPDTVCGIYQVRELENFFQDYQIMVKPFDYKTLEYFNDSNGLKNTFI